MSNGVGYQRNSAAMFVTRAADTATTVLPTGLVWLSLRGRWPHVMGVPVDLVFGLVAAAAVAALAAEWWTTRFCFDDDGIELSRGLLTRRSTSLAWRDVASVQISRTPVARAIGRAQVTVGIGSRARADLVLGTVREQTAQAVQECFGRARDDGPSTTGTTAPSAPDDADRGQAEDALRLVYRMRTRDYLVLSLTYGQFVLLVPWLLGLFDTLSNLERVAGVSLPFEPHRVSWPLAVVALLLAPASAVVFGTAVAWLRFRGFAVRQSADVIETTGGFVSAESRRVAGPQVVGVKIQQNPLMRVTGFARVGVVTRQSGRRVGANIVFPAARLASLPQRLGDSFVRYAGPAGHVGALGPGRTAGRILAAGAGLMVVSAFGAVRGGVPPGLVLIFCLAAVAMLVATNYGWVIAEVGADQRVLAVRRGFAWVTCYVVDLDSVYFAQSLHARVGRGGVGVLGLTIYDSRVVRLWVPARRPDLLDHFTHSLRVKESA